MLYYRGILKGDFEPVAHRAEGERAEHHPDQQRRDTAPPQDAGLSLLAPITIILEGISFFFSHFWLQVEVEWATEPQKAQWVCGYFRVQTGHLTVSVCTEVYHFTNFSTENGPFV